MFLFSIIVPAYNEEKELPQTLEHIHRAIETFQSLRKQNGPVELIVVDNHSTDDTARIAKEMGAKVVAEEKRQIARARNCGSAHAQGEILLFCDADSHLHPETLIKISDLMSGGRWIGGGIRISPDHLTPFNRLGLLVWDIFSGLLQISGGTLFVRKDAFERAGGFPEKFYIGEEVALQFKLKWYGFRNNKKFTLLPGCRVVTSMRKIREFGLLSYGWAVLRCALFPWLAKRREWCSLWYDVRKSTERI